MSRLKNVGSISFVLSILALSLMSTAPAFAQWLPDRAYTEGPGIRLGDFELHPGVAARGGYDSNVFRTDTNRVDSAIFAVTPHLNIKTLGRQRLTQGEEAAGTQREGTLLPPPVTFNLGASGTFFKYFEKQAPTNAEVDASGLVSIMPERAFGVDVGLAYARTIRPFGQFAGFTADNLFALDTIRPTIAFRAQSHSGVLGGSVGYTPQFQFYENDVFSYLNSRQHNVTLGAGWKFLPSTSLVYDGNIGFQQYQNSDHDNAVMLLSPKATTFQSRLGLNGALTNHISLRALVGYAVGHYTERLLNDYEDIIGEVVLRYRVDANVVELGYTRTVQPSPLGAWMEQDRGYLSAETLLGRVFDIKLIGGIGRANYGRLLGPTGTTDLGVDKKTGLPTDKRSDLRGDASLHLEYRATNWLAIMGDVGVLVTNTDFQYPVPGRSPFAASFLSLQAFGGIRLHY